MGVHGGVCLVLTMHEQPCVVTDAATMKVLFRCVVTATIEGSISVSHDQQATRRDGETSAVALAARGREDYSR